MPQSRISYQVGLELNWKQGRFADQFSYIQGVNVFTGDGFGPVKSAEYRLQVEIPKETRSRNANKRTEFIKIINCCALMVKFELVDILEAASKYEHASYKSNKMSFCFAILAFFTKDRPKSLNTR